MFKPFIFMLLLVVWLSCSPPKTMHSEVHDFDQEHIIQTAAAFLKEEVKTITSFNALRSKGGKHDYYSEGPYWWPDPQNPEGPYIRRDGQRNPDMFQAHRSVLKGFDEQVSYLTSAFLLTKDEKYSQKALTHLKAWFVDTATMMHPHLEYAQAIKGIVDGRGIGIIDAIGLIDITNSIHQLSQYNQIPKEDIIAIRNWFFQFTEWLTSSTHGKEESKNNNNHSTWWGAQVAAYALLTGNQHHMIIARTQFKEQLDIQLAEDGSLPEELHRTKPWHYMNYTLDAWATYAALLSNKTYNYWTYHGQKSDLEKAVAFAYPYYQDESTWPYLTALEPKVHLEPAKFMLLASHGLKDFKYKDLWVLLNEKNGSQDPRLFLFKQRFII